jgi:UDP-2,3-diacylglucosamine hydrolase
VPNSEYMTTLFISDLHLTSQRPAVTELFLRFLKTEAANAEALYILGDLFEYWIGDEAVEFSDVRPITSALKTLADSGVPIYVMRGNRDVLLGPGFEKACHCELLDDPTVIDLYGRKTLISHGDYLCTDDVEYQQYRAMVNDRDFQARFLTKDLDEREAIIRTYREISMANSSTKSLDIMDVNQDAVKNAMIEHGVCRMIHGHTHRPNVHHFMIEGKECSRTVLGDWYEQGSILTCDENGCVLKALPMVAASTRSA